MPNLPDQCLDKVTQFFQDNLKGVFLNQSDLKGFMKGVLNEAEKIIQNGNVSREEAIDQVMQKRADDAAVEAQFLHKRSLLQAKSDANVFQILKRHKFNSKGLATILSGIMSKVKGSRLGMSQRITGKLRSLMEGSEGLMTQLNKEGLTTKFYESGNQLPIAKVIRGEGADVADKDLVKIGNIIKNLHEKMRTGYRQVGIAVRKLEDRIGRMFHDPMKIQANDKELRSLVSDIKSGQLKVEERGGFGERQNDEKLTNAETRIRAVYVRWKNYILPRLDMARTFDKDATTEAGIDKTLQGKFRKIIQGVSAEDDLESPFFQKTPGSSFLGGRVTKSRFFHFKEAEGELEYQAKYGAGDLRSILLQDFRGYARDTTFADTFGPNSRRGYERAKNTIINKGPVGIGTSAKLNLLDRVHDNLTGLANSPVNFKMARISANIRSSLGWLKLGLVVPNSLGDFAANASALRYGGKNIFEAWGESMANFRRALGTPEDEKEAMELLGTHVNAMMGSINRFSSDLDNTPSGWVTRVNQIYYKMNVLKAWDNMHVEGQISSTSQWLANRSKTSFDDLDPSVQNLLNQYDIGSKEWDLIRQNPLKETQSGKQFLTPEAVQNASKQSIATYLDTTKSNVSNLRAQAVKDQLENQLMSLYHDRANFVIQHGQASDQAIINMGLRPGTVPGELMRFIMQFRVFGIGFTRRALGQWVNAAPGGRLSAFLGGAELIASSAVLGWVGHMATGYLAGRDPIQELQDHPVKTVLASTLHASGMLADFIGALPSKYGDSYVARAAGPTAEEVDQAATIIGSVFSAPAKNPRTPRIVGNLSDKQFYQYLENHVPNLPMVKATMDYLIGHALHNMVSSSASEESYAQLMKSGQ